MLANRALRIAKPSGRMGDRDVSPEKAAIFLENQLRCNVATRGEMEMAYWWYGSDYRGDNLHYTLSRVILDQRASVLTVHLDRGSCQQDAGVVFAWKRFPMTEGEKSGEIKANISNTICTFTY